MRLALCFALLQVVQPLQPFPRQPSAPRRRQPSTARRHLSQSLDDVDADFRRLLATGLTPTDAFTPVDVAALTLRALKTGDERFLHRFSTPEFVRSRARIKFRGASRSASMAWR